MGRAEAGSTKAIANAIKAKGALVSCDFGTTAGQRDAKLTFP
jgi:hypothetical protein